MKRFRVFLTATYIFVRQYSQDSSTQGRGGCFFLLVLVLLLQCMGEVKRSATAGLQTLSFDKIGMQDLVVPQVVGLMLEVP
jgi:hypothetical protein